MQYRIFFLQCFLPPVPATVFVPLPHPTCTFLTDLGICATSIMDPLSVHMVLRSPPPLQGKMSFSNLVGRKKRSPASDRSSLPKTPGTPKTPKKQTKIDEGSESTPSRSNTVRVRRGFRPLSVLTNSMLIPFEFEALKAMEELEERETKPGAGELVVEEEKDAKQKDAIAENATAAVGDSQLDHLPQSNDSEISLRAFLEQDAPASDVKDEVKASFSALYHLPAPDVNHHPAYTLNPFSSQSDTPSLATTSSPTEIRDFAAQARNSPSHRTNRTSASSDVFGSIERKKFTFFSKLQSPISSPLNQTTTRITDLSPLVQRQAKSRPIEISYSTPNVTDNNSERKRTTSGGLRKLSDIFKSRITSEKSIVPLTPSASASPRAAVEEMESYLRRVTCSPTYPYSDASWYPRHPNTGRFWRSRNLKCTNCVDVCCACCGRTCCAYKAAVLALELTHKDNPEGREEAIEKMQQITMVFPYGRETPTFLQCTTSVGNGAGCGKQVCPDCCGLCPDDACGDVQCRRCKRDPWAICDWHANMSIAASSVDATSVRHTV